MIDLTKQYNYIKGNQSDCQSLGCEWSSAVHDRSRSFTAVHGSIGPFRFVPHCINFVPLRYTLSVPLRISVTARHPTPPHSIATHTSPLHSVPLQVDPINCMPCRVVLCRTVENDISSGSRCTIARYNARFEYKWVDCRIPRPPPPQLPPSLPPSLPVSPLGPLLEPPLGPLLGTRLDHSWGHDCGHDWGNYGCYD